MVFEQSGGSDTRRPDVLVVGAGAVGMAVAYYLARRGADVLVVDERPRVGTGCSFGNAGLITPSHCVPLASPAALRQLPSWLLRSDGAVSIRLRALPSLLAFGAVFAQSCRPQRALVGLRVLRDLARASRAEFDRLAEAGLEFDYRTDGLMNVCRKEHALRLLLEEARLLEREGLRAEVLDGDAARRREPSLRDDILGAVFWVEDAHCDPHRFVTALAAAAQSLGVRIELGVAVRGFRADPSGRITAVETDRRSLRPEWVVLAAGAWSPRLVRPLGLRLPVVAAKGSHAQLESVGPCLRFPLIFQERVFAATPLAGGLRLAGTLEFGRLEDSVDEAKAQSLLRSAAGYLQGLDGSEGFTSWSGLRPVTPDGLPVVGRSSVHANLVYATGHAMLGLTLAPITGLAVSELVANGRTSVPLDALSPRRFRV